MEVEIAKGRNTLLAKGRDSYARAATQSLFSAAAANERGAGERLYDLPAMSPNDARKDCRSIAFKEARGTMCGAAEDM
jgi:hypothetical protein